MRDKARMKEERKQRYLDNMHTRNDYRGDSLMRLHKGLSSTENCHDDCKSSYLSKLPTPGQTNSSNGYLFSSPEYDLKRISRSTTSFYVKTQSF